MNGSKISRSIVVVIFIAVIVCLCLLDISLENVSKMLTFSKLGFAVLTILLTFIYAYIKDKLYKLKIKRSISLIYRYVYLFFVIVIAKLITMRILFNSINIFEGSIYLALNFITAIIIKKIIFNISKSDILSVLALVLYSIFPNIIDDSNVYIISLLVDLFIFAFIFLLQKLIDELKQQKIKSKKYMIYSLILGIIASFCILIGINFYTFVILFLLLFLITSNLDITHITFSKKLLSKLDIKLREKLYKIERISIGKLLISSAIVLCIMLILTPVLNLILKDVYNPVTSIIFNNRITFGAQFKFANADISWIYIKTRLEFLLYNSRNCYLILLIYIIFVELLAILLKRRYDTKSTIIKLVFMLLIGFFSIYNLNMYIYQHVLFILLVIISIISTTNIYLNREERIKLLKASYN